MSHQSRFTSRSQHPCLDSVRPTTAAALPGETGETAAAALTTPATTSATPCRPRPPTRSLVPPSIQPAFYKQTQPSPLINEGSPASSSPDSKVEQLLNKHFISLKRDIMLLRSEVKDTRKELEKLQTATTKIETTKSCLEDQVDDIEILIRSVEDDVSHIRGDTTQIRGDLWQMKGVMLADVRAVREAMRRLTDKIDAQDGFAGHAQQQQREVQDVRDLIQELGARLERLEEGRLPAGVSFMERALGGGRSAAHVGGPSASSSRGARRRGIAAVSAPITGRHHSPANSVVSSSSEGSRDFLDAILHPARPSGRRLTDPGQNAIAPPAKRLRTSDNQDATAGAGEGRSSNTRSAAEEFVARAIRGGRSSDAGRLGGVRRMS